MGSIFWFPLLLSLDPLMGDGGGRCECLPCPFPFLPSGRCSVLALQGSVCWETPPSTALLLLATLHQFWRPWWLFLPPSAPGHPFTHHRVVLSAHAGAEALLHGLRTGIYFCCCIWPRAVPSRVTAVRPRRKKHLFGRGWGGVDVSGVHPSLWSKALLFLKKKTPSSSWQPGWE